MNNFTNKKAVRFGATGETFVVGNHVSIKYKSGGEFKTVVGWLRNIHFTAGSMSIAPSFDTLPEAETKVSMDLIVDMKKTSLKL